MISAMTRRPIEVETDGGAGPYIDIVLDQLDEVIRLFDSNAVPYFYCNG